MSTTSITEVGSFEMGQPQGIAPTQCHVGAIPLDEPFALKYLFICASVLKPWGKL